MNYKSLNLTLYHYIESGYCFEWKTRRVKTPLAAYFSWCSCHEIWNVLSFWISRHGERTAGDRMQICLAGEATVAEEICDDESGIALSCEET